MARPSWCDTCRPTGVRCEPCDQFRLAKNQARMRSYERLKQDPVRLEIHRARSLAGMQDLKADRWARGLTITGNERTNNPSAAIAADIEEKIMAIQTIPRCENCPAIGRACPKCRSAHRRAQYLAEHGELERKPIPRCANCPPTGAPCRPCRSAYEAARMIERMKDPIYAEKRRAIVEAAEQRRKEREAAAGIKRARKAPRPEGEVPKKKGAPPTRPRCANCPPVGEPCRPCYNAHRARIRKPRENRAAQRLASALTHAELVVAKREMKIAPGKRAIPRCANCPEVGQPCRECYNRYKRGGGEKQSPGLRQRPSAAPSRPAPRPKVSAEIEQKAAATAATAAAPPGRRDRNWDLDTCAVCMRKGRFGGQAACPRCVGQAAPPPGWEASQKATGYTAEFNAAKREASA